MAPCLHLSSHNSCFRHMRVFVFIALFGSTYVAFYMVAESIKHGFANAGEAASRQPTSIADIFQVWVVWVHQTRVKQSSNSTSGLVWGKERGKAR